MREFKIGHEIIIDPIGTLKITDIWHDNDRLLLRADICGEELHVRGSIKKECIIEYISDEMANLIFI